MISFGVILLVLSIARDLLSAFPLHPDTLFDRITTLKHLRIKLIKLIII